MLNSLINQSISTTEPSSQSAYAQPKSSGEAIAPQSHATGLESPVMDSYIGASSVSAPKNQQEAYALRDAIVSICRENTTNTSGVAEVRARIQPMVDRLETYFAANRPENETELTQGVWKNLWYDDPDIKDRGALKLNRDRVWQVVRDGYYYNVSDSNLEPAGLSLGRLSNYLKGAYTVINKPTGENQGAKRLNVIELKFVYNGLRFGELPAGESLDELVDSVEDSSWGSLKIPGPYGVEGELWNLYIDDKVRISAGFDKSNPFVLDLYILERGESVQASA